MAWKGNEHEIHRTEVGFIIPGSPKLLSAKDVQGTAQL